MTEERRNELSEAIKTGSIGRTDGSTLDEILSDKELSDLYREYDKLSAALGDAFADPPKDKEGRTLSEVLAERVRKGDVLPRYADVSKHHFPFATAACLVIACAVLLFAGKNGILGRSKYAADTALDECIEEPGETEEAAAENAVLCEEAPVNDMADRIKEKETYFYAAGGAGGAAAVPNENAGISDTPEVASLDSLAGAAEETAEEDAGDTEAEEAENSAEKPMVMMMTAPNVSDSARDDKNIKQKAEGGEDTAFSAEEKTAINDTGGDNGFANGRAANGMTANGDSANAYADTTVNGGITNGRAGGTGSSSDARTENGNSIGSSDGNASGILIPEDILGRMEEAKLLFEEAGLEMQDDAVIEASDIFRYGEDNYRAYFDSIIGEEDFTSRYGLSSFIAFCEAA